MVAHWHTVITEDVDLVISFLTLTDDVLELLDFLYPTRSDVIVEELSDLWILEIF